LRIKTIGDEVLRKVAKEVTNFDSELERISREMLDTMHEADGIGLAAPQVGISIRMLVTDVSPLEKEYGEMVFVNPSILETWGEKSVEEGCLSIPGVREDVLRPEEIRVQYHTVTGEEKVEKYDGWMARVLQHEIDHLNGVLFTDHLSPVKQKLVLNQFSNI
jgi:peptide deformylase